MTNTLTLQEISQLTPDTYQLTFNRPDGFDFQSGQATELAIQKDGLKDKSRPFTMTSRPSDPHLEFVIKSYPDHDGVTQHIPKLAMTDEVTATDPFGAITDRGAGVFIAGGAGITPFISILRKQQQEGVSGSQLIFANKTDADIILQETWQSMPTVSQSFVISDQPDTDFIKGRVDADLLRDHVANFDQPFYLCGPGGMVDAVRDTLTSIGVAKDRIITEDGW